MVAVAQTNYKLIVTHDKRMDDYIKNHQRGKKLHRCLNGLVLLPSGYGKQEERLKSIARREAPLMLQDVEIFWYDVWQYNLFADLRDVHWPIVTTLCRCGVEQMAKDFKRLGIV